MIKDNCVHFLPEWILDLKSPIIYAKSEDKATDIFYNALKTTSIEIKDCERTGEHTCLVYHLMEDGECPSNCQYFEEAV